MLQKLLTLADRHKSLTVRNISPLQYRSQDVLLLKDHNELYDIKRLGKYIGSNIKSERRNVMSLYSTSYKVLQRNKKFLLPEIEVSNKNKALKRKSNHSAMLDPNHSTTLFPICQTSNHNPDVVISNNFPTSNIRTSIKKEKSIKVIKWQSPKKSRQVEETHTIQVHQQSPAHPKIEIRQRPQQRRQLIKRIDKDDLNPWEYLKIQEEVSINQMA